MTLPFRKRLIIVPALILFALYLAVWPPYLLKQGWFLFSYYGSRESIKEISTGGNLTEKEKLLFESIADIKTYALSDLGLVNNDNYSRYIRVDHDYINLVVSAAPPLALEPEMWSFPLFGDFPYLGFFNSEDAYSEAEKLKGLGLDVYVRKAGAFSTLGILSDPVYSYFADYSLLRLAGLIIHEQTHATLFLKSRIRFNEELATFVGNTGSLKYIETRFGRKSEEYRKALKQIKTSEEIYTYFDDLHQLLSRVYQKQTGPAEALREKEKILFLSKVKFMEQFKNISPKGLKYYRDTEWNNAFILSFVRYGADLELFEKLYRKNDSSIKKMLESLKILETLDEEPKAYIKRVLLHEKK